MYDIIETIYEGSETFIYKAIDKNDNRKVVIKVLKSDHPSPQSIARLKYEFNIAKDLDIEGVIKYYDFTKVNHSPALILEDIDAVSLSDTLKERGRLNLKDFLDISIKIAQTLSQIHKKNIIHKDIKSHNIIINLENNLVKLIDFGIASKNISEQVKQNSKELKGTLLYISPEQTGRTNQKIDSRTDLYSLGVTFYEMLTGKLPFESKDFMELIYSHIALKPKPLTSYDKSIPEQLSDIVMKLLSKNPQDRYQSASGLKYDLEKCLHQYMTEGSIENFDIGQKDIPTYLQLPDKLYGRDKELNLIDERISEKESNKNGKLIIITGEAGVGKTAIGKHIHNMTLKNDNKFTSGNFNQFQQNIPYYGIKEALTYLIKKFLTEADNKSLANMKTTLDKELKDYSVYLTSIIPLLEKIMGKNEDIKDLDEIPPEVFIKAFQTLFKVFAKDKLVMLLDDFHYADPASINFLKKTILDGSENNIVFILLYRNDELDNNKKWNEILNQVKENKPEYLLELILQNLQTDDIEKLVSDILFRKVNKELGELAEQIHKKTGGNPYFIENLLKTMYEQKILYFDYEKYKWSWKIDEVRNMNIMDNAVELITGKISKLKPDTKKILNIASCIGNIFNIAFLSFLYKDTYTNISHYLEQAVSMDIITPIGDEYKYVTDELKEKDAEKVCYKFLHNRIQQAFYELLSEEEKNRYHLQIGRYILDQSSEEEIKENIFNIVNNLNKAIPLIQTDDKIKELIELNIEASKKATKACAYDMGLKYSKISTDLFPEHFWEKELDIGIKVFERRARCEGLCINYDNVEYYTNIAISHAKSIEDKIRLYSLMVIKHSKAGDFAKSIEVGIKGLREIGLDFPDTDEELIELEKEEEQKIKEKMKDKNLEDITKLPEMEDNIQKSIINLLSNIHVSSNAIWKLHVKNICTLKQINIILTHGYTEYTPDYYLNYGVYLSRKDEPEDAYNWGQIAMKMTDASDNNVLKCSVYNTFASQLNSLKNPRKKAFPIFEKAYKCAVEAGVKGKAAAILANSSIQAFEAGQNLGTLLTYVEEGLDYAKKIKHSVVTKVLTLLRQGILCLLGRTVSPDSFSVEEIKSDREETFDEEETYKKMKEAEFGIGLNWYYIIKMKTLFVNNEFEKAIEIQRCLENFQEGDIEDKGIRHVCESHIFDKYSEDEKRDKLQQMHNLIQEFEQTKDKVEFYKLPIAYLFIAEYHKLKKETQEAIEYYEEALNYAIENENLMFITKIYECMALFFIQLGIESAGKVYMTEAFQSYKEWGVDGKIRLLLRDYGDYISKDIAKDDSSMDYNASTISLTTSSDDGGNLLDLSTIMKASNAIAGEIELENLLNKLIRIIIENAGAQKAFIILKRDNQLLIEAQADIDHIDDIKVKQSIPVEESDLVPHSIIKYVERTEENVVLKNASTNPNYNSDKYIKNNNIISVLSIPLINQGEFTGLLYLENNLMEGVFTPQRLEVLKMLSTQMSISIKNASLYTETKIQKTTIQVYSEQLENIVRERTAELQEANQELEVAFKEVNELKIQQDGDYYLTSLLINPLIRNQVDSDYVKADFYISQKKKFKFREWSAELGGDICIADTLVLNNPEGNKTYTVFVNGDAMGKSIQGAGGALVLGVVFNAFVSRTKMVPDASNLAPEEWLIRCYRELQDVFVSFSGTMMISVVMGIIDDETGMMYFFNAEHPWSILYREGKAEFIERELLNHKIGMRLGENRIILKKYRLQAGDSIFTGSDGRDDIYIKEDNGKFHFNRDQNLILKFIEKGNGKLENIINIIYDKSEPRDDLSIMKIYYQGNDLYNVKDEKLYNELRNEAIRLYKENKLNDSIDKSSKALNIKKDKQCFNITLKSYLKTKQYKKALSTVKEAIKYYPGDMTFIYYCSILNNKYNNYDTALYYSKRYYIHNQNNMEIILNMVEIYIKLKRYKEARKHLKEAEKINNGHNKISTLKEQLEKHL